MQRRTFLKTSAIGLGTLAGVQKGVLNSYESAAQGQADSAIASGGTRSAQEWGINAAVLKSPWPTTPSWEALRADRDHSLVVDNFYRVGGENRPATPTECRISYDSAALYVTFSCSEDDMSFPYSNLDPTYWPEVDWYSLTGLPSGAITNWPPYPDEVDILIQPDKAVSSYYQFAATLQGLKFGCRRSLESNSDPSPDEAATHPNWKPKTQKIDAFDASVTRGEKEWVATFRIPWQSLNGKPSQFFAFLPMRTRWRDGEFSSPVALDFNEALPVDLLIQTHFTGSAEVENAGANLCRLPSGSLRWQRPLHLTYPDLTTCRQIWQMEQALSTPTSAQNLGRRVHLTQRWMDLMTLEGFTPLPSSWGNLPHDLTIAYIRQAVNAQLEKNDVARACTLLDTYLSRLDKMSRWWYADGSPGDILSDEWIPITRATELTVQADRLSMRCAAGNRQIDLTLVLPATGGVRVFGSDEGYWRPASLTPLKATSDQNSCRIETAEGRVTVYRDPFSITFADRSGNAVTSIGAGNLALRFDTNGKVAAIDFKNSLDPREVIFGFGEKYDHFDKKGTVLTLWGTDDWVGNGKGLANTTYKPLPIFHSTRSYMFFSNSSYRLRADIGMTDPHRYRLTQLGPILDFYIWVGNPLQSLQSYTALTGTPPLPPKWVFEPWMGRGGHAWTEGKLHDAVVEEETVAARFAELDIPHSAIYAEGPSALSPELNRFMAKRNVRILGYFMPELGLSRMEKLMPELRTDEVPVVHCGTDAQTRALGYVDFTNPRALEMCRRALQPALDLGEAGSMVDYGDLTPDDATFYDGQRGAEMHNFYYYDYQRTICEVFREKRGDDFILYGRGAAPGTQRWVGQFAGDHPATFVGLKHVVTGALNLCACGYSNWGSDLGGYFGLPQPAVYMRWFQFGCFSPLMRPHGTAPRDPWYFSEAAVANYKFLAWTRENLLSYNHNSAVLAHTSGASMVRSMPVAFPAEALVAAVDDQYMFGPDLLVAPVLNQHTFREIAFPSGQWTSLWNGKTVTGGRVVRVEAPLDTIPVYLRPGAAVPVELNRELQFGGSMSAGRIHALVATMPPEPQMKSLRNAEDREARVTAQPTSRGCKWTLHNLPELHYLLVYGRATASAVIVNGQQVATLPDKEPSPAVTGWRADAAGNRIEVSLPSRRREDSELLTTVELEFE